METFTIATSKCWIDFLKSSLSAVIERDLPNEEKVRQILALTTRFFKTQWPNIIELIKGEEAANVSKTRTQSKCRVAFTNNVAPYFEQEFKALNCLVTQGLESSFETSLITQELAIQHALFSVLMIGEQTRSGAKTKHRLEKALKKALRKF